MTILILAIAFLLFDKIGQEIDKGDCAKYLF